MRFISTYLRPEITWREECSVCWLCNSNKDLVALLLKTLLRMSFYPSEEACDGGLRQFRNRPILSALQRPLFRNRSLETKRKVETLSAFLCK